MCIAIGAFAFGVNGASAWASFSGPNGRIAFGSDTGSDRDILTMNPDGSGVANLTADASAPAFAFEPDYSPDGTKIAFRAGAGNAGEIYTMNADGTGLTQLTFNSIKDYGPTWSSDGSMIAFASNRNDPDPANCINLFGCNIDIFVMPATGGPATQVTFDSGADSFAEFSPTDRSLIAYNSDTGGVNAVYTVDIDTMAVTKLTADGLRAGLPDWSPDGTRIAFSTNWYACKRPKVCKANIGVMSAVGGSVIVLTSKFGDNLWPAWSPQGDKIVFTHNNLEQKPYQLYIVKPDGTGLARITHTNDNSLVPDWGTG